jgi:serine/threonine protein kinase
MNNNKNENSITDNNIAELYGLMELSFDQIDQLEDTIGDGDFTGLLFGMPVIIRYLGYNSERLQSLVRNLSIYNHPSTPINYGIMIKKENSEKVYIVRELFRGKNFFSICNIDIYNKIIIIYKLICLLEFLHSFDVYYIFLKPGKIIFSSVMIVKLLDIVKDDEELLNNLKKTPFNDEIRFYCPELYNKTITLDDLKSPKFDIYSVGCIIFYAIFQELPWKDYNNKEEILNLYTNNENFLEEETKYNNEYIHIIKLVRKCLNNEFVNISELKSEWEKFPEVVNYIKNDYVNVDFQKGECMFFKM